MEIPEFYIVKSGQTAEKIACAFSLPVCLLIAVNRLTEEVRAGQILKIPNVRGNLYTVRAGDSKELLCGSEENYEKKNGTSLLYPGQIVFLC